MWDKLASLMGSGVSQALDSIKKIAIDTWHIDPAKAAELDLAKDKIEQEVRLKLADELGKLEALDAADRDSARKREMEVKDNTNSVMAYTITGVMFTCTVYFNIYPPVPEVKPIVENVVMALRDGWLIVVAYYFGSSRGSAAKHEMIERLTK